MHTKQKIQSLLAGYGVGPNKRLGQHFLMDLNLMRLVVESAQLSADDIVLEVGCGTGSMTEALAQAAGAVIAVEYDRTLAQIATEELKNFSNITLINDDILQNKHHINQNVIDAAVAAAKQKFMGRFMLVANLPYSISSALMMNLIQGPLIADAMTVTVQQEVAVRMAAEAGDDDYGILSIFMAACGEVRILRKLNRKVFWPAPQVDSAIVRFDRRSDKVRQIKDMKLFRQVVDSLMSHRRKMIKGCIRFAAEPLSKIDNWPKIFDKAQIDSALRPEQLTAPQYIMLANIISEALH